MLRALLILLALLPLAACNRPEAPQDVGACWRTDAGAGQPPKFTLLAKGVGDLDTCAVLLESLRLQGEKRTNGAYQGFFIFVDANGMSSARRADGFRYPIFQPPQRLAVDRDLRRMMQARGGRMPDVSDLAIERQ